jgi:hypothetical protein
VRPKDYVKEKFQLHNQEMNPRHSGLQRIASNNNATLRAVTGYLRKFQKHNHILKLTGNNVQSDSGGKVNILGGDGISDCEKKVHMNTCLIVNRYRDTAL